ncbi:MAG TPA: hypothetical protein VFF73_16815, partial [Planctomycetota bacterium]|nr:hypothetical protein [Planctomycetota bacterium]
MTRPASSRIHVVQGDLAPGAFALLSRLEGMGGPGEEEDEFSDEMDEDDEFSEDEFEDADDEEMADEELEDDAEDDDDEFDDGELGDD